MKCIDATRLASESQDRELSLTERASLQMHLVICSGCRRFTSQLGVLRQASRRVEHLSADGLASGQSDDAHEDAPPPRG